MRGLVSVASGASSSSTTCRTPRRLVTCCSPLGWLLWVPASLHFSPHFRRALCWRVAPIHSLTTVRYILEDTSREALSQAGRRTSSCARSRQIQADRDSERPADLETSVKRDTWDSANKETEEKHGKALALSSLEKQATVWPEWSSHNIEVHVKAL